MHVVVCGPRRFDALLIKTNMYQKNAVKGRVDIKTLRNIGNHSTC